MFLPQSFNVNVIVPVIMGTGHHMNIWNLLYKDLTPFQFMATALVDMAHVGPQVTEVQQDHQV